MIRIMGRLEKQEPEEIDTVEDEEEAGGEVRGFVFALEMVPEETPTPKTKVAALRGSVWKWAAKVCKMPFSSDCTACMFDARRGDGDCRKCPIYEASVNYTEGCGGTPHSAWAALRYIGSPQEDQAALDEFNFLLQLLEKRDRKLPRGSIVCNP